jgi:hypothetical protein
MPLKNKSPDTLNPNPEPGCFTVLEAGRCLIVTQADGTTEGFPLTWLYRWQWRQQSAEELLTLTLTEHEVTVHGKNLEAMTESLSKSIGLHLSVKNDRYQSVHPSNEVLITRITIKPTAKSQSMPTHSDQG